LDHEGLTTAPHFPRNVLCVIKRVRCETAREAEVAQLEVEVRMPAPSSFDENTTRRPICRAVQMLRSMSCPFVLGYIDSWMHRDSLCIVTEYCPGGDLYQHLKREKVDLSEDTVLDYFLQTTQALAHLHERAVMHRDVKVRALCIRARCRQRAWCCEVALAFSHIGIQSQNIFIADNGRLRLGKPCCRLLFCRH